MQGRGSAEISEVLGYCGSEEVMHRDNISMTMIRNPPNSSSSTLEAAGQRSPDGSASTIAGPAATEPGTSDR